MTTNKTFTIIRTGGAPDAKSEFEVHAAGCRDIARTVARSPFVEAFPSVEAPSAEALVAAEVEDYDAQDQGWTAADHLILPCCKTRKTAKAKARAAAAKPKPKAAKPKAKRVAKTAPVADGPVSGKSIPRKRGTGSIFVRKTGTRRFLTAISIDGKRQRHLFETQADAEAWLTAAAHHVKPGVRIAR